MRRVDGLVALGCICLFLNIKSSQTQVVLQSSLNPAAVGKANSDYLLNAITKHP